MDFLRAITVFRNNVRRPAMALAVATLAGCATTNPVGFIKMPINDRAVQRQIFLDSQNFGPGVIDGHAGEFTDKAEAFFRQKYGLAPDAELQTASIIPYTNYTISTQDVALVGTMAAEPADLAKQNRLPYTSMGEVIAERYHTTEEFLWRLNPDVDRYHLPVGTVLKVPNVSRPLDTSKFPSHYASPSKAATAHRQIVVDTSTRMLEVRDSGRIVAAFPITPGSPEHPAPLGDWKVVRAVPWPWYRYDEGVLERGERTKVFFNLPPGPNSPVGLLWTALNRPGVGIHGTPFPETIGRAGSHGCIRLSNWDAATFYTLVRSGLPVTIR